MLATEKPNSALGFIKAAAKRPKMGLVSPSWGPRTLVFSALAVLLVGLAQADVEYKHHNNTEMAEILQQVHNR